MKKGTNFLYNVLGQSLLQNSNFDLSDVVLFGFGRVAQRNIKKLSEDFSIKAVIENNQEARSKIALGCPVLPLKEASHYLGSYKIIVTTSSLAYGSIKKELEGFGLKEYKDFCRLEIFMLEWYWRNRGQVCISQVLSAVTTRCTFKCRYCSNLMPYFKDQFDYTEDDISGDLAALFSYVDYLASYYLMGGEPLLNKRLPQILASVCESFGNRIGYIQVITNGSILSWEELIDTMRLYDINVRVSNYTRAVPYKERYEDVLRVFGKNRIEYSVSDYKSWMNLGFPEEHINISGNIGQHLRACSQGCHSVNDGKFYY